MELPLNRWTHIALTQLSGQTKLYVDGILTFESNGRPPNHPSNGFSIGGRWSYSFNGAIDEVCVFERALSNAEVKSLYVAGSYGMCQPIELTPELTSESNFQLRITGARGVAIVLYHSEDLENWSPVARLDNPTGQVVHELSDLGIRGYFRAVTLW